MKKNEDDPVKALQEAIDIAGSQNKLGALIGKTQGHITVWLKRNKKAPAEMVLLIEKETGVSRHRLRPDVFGEKDDRATA